MTGNKFICYLDILGFKSRIDDGKFKEGYEWIIKEIVEPFNYPNKVYLLSDSIIIMSNDIKDIVNNSFSIYSQALHKGIFIRGGLTKGKINTPQELRESGNKLVIPYLGEAYCLSETLSHATSAVSCSAIPIGRFFSLTIWLIHSTSFWLAVRSVLWDVVSNGEEILSGFPLILDIFFFF